MISRGGWPEIAAGQVLKLGMRDPRVATLRERLSITGEYRPHLGVAEPETYDEDLAEAVKRFQASMALMSMEFWGPAHFAP
jgi:murein L,D-transpeptidase YcbB/YkuD